MLSFDLLKISQNSLIIEFNGKFIIIIYRIELEESSNRFSIHSNYFTNYKSREKKNNFKINMRKVNFQRGIEHISSKGKLIKVRKVRVTCGHVCIHNCDSRITIKEHKKIFNTSIIIN